MMVDIFTRIRDNMGPLGRYAEQAEGYYIFPELQGELSNRMNFHGKEVIVWSINNYLGLANDKEVRKVDVELAGQYGTAYPMGSRMMSGNTALHSQFEKELSTFVQKEKSVLLNFGYQGIMSAIDCLLTRRDVVVYDAGCHACIVDGVRLHSGKRFVFKHNDMESLEKQLEHAQLVAEEQGGGVLVISEGVFGMRGDQGKLKEICALKKRFSFRLLVDDAHGFGTLGVDGSGAGVEQGVQSEIDLYFATFAKALGSIGAFISGDQDAIQFIKYNMRSQIFAKSLPSMVVGGALHRLRMITKSTARKDKLWSNVQRLQTGLKEAGFDIGNTNSCVTPVYMHGSVEEAMILVKDLRDNFAIFCSIVVYPVIPKGMILLRLIPTAVHTFTDIDETIVAFKQVQTKLENAEYQIEVKN